MSAVTSDIYKLEFLNLVSKLVAVIFNHLDMKDPSLAEFVISLHDPDIEVFKQRLEEVQSGFPLSLVQTIHRLILTLHPKYNTPQESITKSSATASTSSNKSSIRNEGLFPGLAMPDTEPERNVPDISEIMGSFESAAPSSRYQDDDRGRKRSRYDNASNNNSNNNQQYQRSAPPSLDSEPILFKIYDGTVSNIRDFGAFVSLHGIQGRHEGMVHVSAIQNGLSRGTMPRDVLTRNQPVKVKVLSAAGGRLSLSMKDVDQKTGMDFTPHLQPKSAAEIQEEDRRYRAQSGASGANSIRLFSDETATFIPTASSNARSTLKRMSSPERWEIKQLIASGAAKASDYPELDEDFGTINGSGGAVGYEIEEELDIEIQDAEPAFLSGQTKFTMDLSPIKLVKAPDGTLGRAAVSSSAYAKERKELKQQEEKELADSNPRDVNSAWLDPMTNPAERQFAQDVRSGSDSRSSSQPAWKIAIQPKISSLGDLNRAKMSMKQQRESLPVFRFRQQLLDAIKENQVLVVRGETGSGKTTQMTQYLAEAGYANHGKKIGCTQPRRIAATSVAKRVADEIGCTLGQEVGYSIRFEDCTSAATKIKYMTDGLLLRECLIDPDMSQYSVIILDEAHERTINTDVLFGLIKKTLKKRPDLKFICTSATLDSEKFSEYFDQAKMFNIPGRAFPVEVLYTKEPESDYLDAALITVMQIHLSEPAGDILVFLTGEEEINTSCEILHQRMQALGSQVPELIILPMYSALPADIQSEIFDPAPPGARKVIVSTNIAETSITVDGVFYVIDPGFSKQNAYDPKLHMQTLVVTPISQAQANQRSGRAGRTGPGKAYRLYTEAAFRNEMMPNPIPAIQRENLCSIILTLKAMGINDLLHFDFMDPPSPQTLISALENLYSLSALDNEGLLTRLGRKMADFPLDPELSKMLITSVELGCSEEAMTIIAMLSEQSIFFRPKDKQAAADAKKAKFHQPEGDHLTLLAVYNGWKASKFSSPWCSENYIQARSMAKVEKTRKQLLGLLDRHRSDIISCGRDYAKIRRAIAAGFFANAAKKDPQEGYKTLAEGTPVAIHPSSSLFNKNPDWVLYHSLISTTKEYMSNVMAIEPKWLTEVAPNKYKIADASKISKRKRNERIEPLFNKFEEKDSWRLSKQKTSSRSSQTFG